ncbi:/ yidA / Phosphatase YidA /:282490 Reverse [Candidatus Hepatoplasma crinochetorum]|uniref:/ yidA / Phosphatase YidA /:282490 Reverse n=1 Tax=Candidatus Hepatoplasma crinochetorum TaxID=295596 RepID=A0A0G7ZMM9_9MOLU|nr:/ yidA / Phosphatase YidA /:282490 Reverse [Candidatus Hepatoplasma crinochetorum]
MNKEIELNSKKEKWLIAIDIDRTLIPDQEINQETNSIKSENYILDGEIKILDRLIRQGHKVVIATGRSLKSAEELFNNIKLNIILSNFNGCHISIPNKNKILLDTKMNLNSLKKIAKDKILNDIKYNLVFKYLDYVRMDNFNDELVFDLYNNFSNFKIKKLDIKNIKDEPISAYMHLKIKENINLDKILKNLNKKYGNELNLWFWRDKIGDSIVLEINNKKYNKWSSILFIADKYKIKKENIITIGDNLNDYEMIKNANHGVAMINGLDEIKEIANYITKYDNNNGGVSHFLNNFFEKKDI